MSKTDDNEGLYAIAGLLLVLPSAAWSGFVLTRMWLWFVVPLGVPTITIWHAAGLSIVCGWLAGAHTSDNEDKQSAAARFIGLLARAAILPPVFWLFGVIFHTLMVSS